MATAASQAKYERRVKQQGGARLGVLLSPRAARALEELAKRYGSRKAAVEAALEILDEALRTKDEQP